MSFSEIAMKLNSFSDNWYGAKAAIEDEMIAISRAFERIRTSRQIQDELMEHLFAVHRRWCETCPRQDPGRGRRRLPEKDGTNSRVETVASRSPPLELEVSASVGTQTLGTASIANQHENAGDFDDAIDVTGGSSMPLSMISHSEDGDVLSDVNRVLEKDSNEQGVCTTFMKVEALEVDRYSDILLEQDQTDIDIESSNMGATSQPRHEEEQSSQLDESDGQQTHLTFVNTVMKHEIDSHEDCDLLMDGNSCKDTSNLGLKKDIPEGRSDGTTSYAFEGNGSLPNPDGVPDDHGSLSFDSNTEVQTTPASDGINGEEPFCCDVCDYRCYDRKHLARHRRTHTGQRPYQCLICCERFEQAGHLHAHMRTHTGQKESSNVCYRKQSGGKAYSCNVCDYKTSRKNHFRMHMRIHLGLKPYECSLCGKSFTQSSHLKTHMRMHTGLKPFHCIHCHKSFSQSSNLKSHRCKKTHQAVEAENLFEN